MAIGSDTVSDPGTRRVCLEWNKGTAANHSPLCLRHTQGYPELRCLDGRCTGRAFQCLGDSLNASFRLCHRLQCANVVFRPCTANNFLLGQMTAPFLGERPSNIPSHNCNACLRSWIASFIQQRRSTRRSYCLPRQRRGRNLIRKNHRPFSTPQQGPWRVVLRIQESLDYVPVRRETVLNHQLCERNNASRRNSSCDGWHPVTNKSDIKTYPY